MEFAERLKKKSAEAGTRQEDQNLALISGSGGLLPPQARQDMRIMTVTSSHTSAVVRVAEGGGRGVNDALCGDDGMISKQKILEGAASFSEPFEKGMPYTIYRKELDEACEHLATFLSETGNVGHGVHREQTIVQTMMQVHDRIRVAMKMNSNVDLKMIAAAIEASKPTLEGKYSISRLMYQSMGAATRNRNIFGT